MRLGTRLGMKIPARVRVVVLALGWVTGMPSVPPSAIPRRMPVPGWYGMTGGYPQPAW